MKKKHCQLQECIFMSVLPNYLTGEYSQHAALLQKHASYNIFMILSNHMAC
jgi:hypothetical protein